MTIKHLVTSKHAPREEIYDVHIIEKDRDGTLTLINEDSEIIAMFAPMAWLSVVSVDEPDAEEEGSDDNASG